MGAIGTRKFTDRLIIALAFSVILIIILFIFHINMYMEMSKSLNKQVEDNVNRPIVRTIKRDFVRNMVQSQSISDERPIESTGPVVIPTEKFQDLHDAIDKLETAQLGDSSSSSSSVSNPTLGELFHMKITRETTSLDRFHMQITAHEMYPENSTVVEQLLNDMANLPIQKVEEKEGGTQFKLSINYRNGMYALFKPKRLERDQQNPPNQMYFSEFERHNAEIAAFHVDRLLGFRRALPTTGRIINAVTQIMRIGNSELKRTFYKSLKPDENICFTGNCEQFCDEHHPICAKGDQLEGSFMAYLPDEEDSRRKSYLHPFKRTYNVNEKEQWLTDPHYCEKIKKDFPIGQGRHMLDFMDTAVLDFLIGNRDRHNFQTFNIFPHAFHMHYDHGRSFGLPYYDDFTILAPLSQCCVIRVSTLQTLLRFHHGPKPLSVELRQALANDPISPVLWEPHYAALDRRIEEILKAIRKCIAKNSIRNVIIFP